MLRLLRGSNGGRLARDGVEGNPVRRLALLGSVRLCVSADALH